MRAGCPIFPVGIVGTDQIQPPDAKAPKLFKSGTIKIGRPMRPERYADRAEKHLAWRSMTDEVMFEIRELTGQEYVNRYAGKTDDNEPVVPSRPAHVADPESLPTQSTRRCGHRRRAPRPAGGLTSHRGANPMHAGRQQAPGRRIGRACPINISLPDGSVRSFDDGRPRR